MTMENFNNTSSNKLELITKLKDIIESNRDKLQQIVIQAEHGEWDRASALSEAERLKDEAIEAARLLEFIIRNQTA
jgi:hypothetical protein